MKDTWTITKMGGGDGRKLGSTGGAGLGIQERKLYLNKS
jgi:hypothetical protein